MSETYSILNLKKYAESIRKNASISIFQNEKILNIEGLTLPNTINGYITIKQVCFIIKNHVVGYSSENKPIIDEHGYNNAFEEVRGWIANCIFSKLAANNILECNWDNEKKEMMFWIEKEKEEFLPLFHKWLVKWLQSNDVDNSA